MPWPEHDARVGGFEARTARRDRDRPSDDRTRRPGQRPEKPRAARRGPARPGPKATPRRGRRPADRLSVGAIVLSTAVGLALLGIAERALLEGGPLGGASGSVGAQRTIKPGGQGGGASEQPRPPAQRQPGAAAGGAAAEPAGPSLRALAGQVRRLMLTERGAAARQAYGAAPTRPPIVGATRVSSDRTWVFGTAVIPVPDSSDATPEVAFYTARWTGREWQAGLAGGKTFSALLGAAPADVVPPAEAALMRKYAAVTAEQAAALVNGTRAGDRLMLPWRIGQAWAMTTSDGAASPRPLGSLAFSGGDGRVLASGRGRLYRFCGGSAGQAMVMLVHGSGLATTYYGLGEMTRVRDGAVVDRGDVLGRTGTARPCGGAPAARAEVGFGLRSGAGQVAFDGARIGGWTFQERADPLLGFAERGELQVLPGGLLANLGPVPPADDPAPPSPGASPKAGADPAPAATPKKRSPNGANPQQ